MLSSILAWLGSLLSGPFIQAVLQGYTAKLTAQDTAEQIQANLAAQKAQIDARREALEQQIVIAEEGKYWPVVRWGFAFPFMLFNFKVIVWDRMLHWGATDPLSNDLTQLEMVIVAAYFGHSALTNVGRALARKKS